MILIISSSEEIWFAVLIELSTIVLSKYIIIINGQQRNREDTQLLGPLLYPRCFKKLRQQLAKKTIQKKSPGVSPGQEQGPKSH